MAEPAATERWRLFVAVPTTPELRSVLAETVSALRARPGADDDWRWTDADAWHLTLAFLGRTDASRVPELRTAQAAGICHEGFKSRHSRGQGG
ncbi:MAG TPA: 2'-5' RNA ligase family protein, partial [Candidatus Limnocylindria bacterium]|nr:2'-5' RNA ligase family protein [Candidatus Limnocylindria bacterium]